MAPFNLTPAHRERLLQDAERHEGIALAMREIAGFGRPSDAAIAAAPQIDGWGFAPHVGTDLIGTWKVPGQPELADGRAGRVLLNSPDMTAVLTDSGWFRLGMPNDVRAKVSGAIQ